jgi:hypothetical protein
LLPGFRIQTFITPSISICGQYFLIFFNMCFEARMYLYRNNMMAQMTNSSCPIDANEKKHILRSSINVSRYPIRANEKKHILRWSINVSR